MDIEFTSTERRILKLLSDGMRHNRKEVRDTCLNDDLADFHALQLHIGRMRKKLRLRGEDIVCEYYSMSFHYRHVRLLASSVDGYI